MDDLESREHPTLRNRFIGSLLGLGIGDALGMPVEGWSRERIQQEHGWIDDYLPRRDETGQISVAAGEFTDDTELALIHVESLISSNGFIDPEGIGIRMVRLLRGDSTRFLDATTRAALLRIDESGDYQSGLPSPDGRPGNGVAARIAPIGLLHALGRFNAEVFSREVLRAGLITHCDPESLNGALAIAFAIRLIVNQEVPPEMLLDEVASFIDEDDVARKLRFAAALRLPEPTPERVVACLQRIGTSESVAESVAAALFCFVSFPDDFEQAVLSAVNAGGDTDSIAAMTGALSGAQVGASRIPVRLVDGLEGRMYILVAGPGLYRAAQRRAGMFLKLLEQE